LRKKHKNGTNIADILCNKTDETPTGAVRPGGFYQKKREFD